MFVFGLRPSVICPSGGPGDGEQRGAELPQLPDGVPGGRLRRVPQLRQRGAERKRHHT